MTDERSFELHYAEEWAALYVDGELINVGDSYHSEEMALHMLGVKIVQDDAFMRGQTQRSGVAKTLDEVNEYASAREQRLTRAAALKAQAAQLLEEAAALKAQAEDPAR